MDDWQTWRKQQRAQLITLRKTVTKEDHSLWSHTITTLLQQGFPKLCKNNIGIYWPIHREFDPRPAAIYFYQQGATLALPEVVSKHTPLCFQKWWPDAPMKEGAYGIPTPENTGIINVDVVMIPMLGFDSQGYRLGYGSGYFDRTLAITKPRPLVIGIAFEISHLNSIYPQPHDIPMDVVITEAGVYQNAGKKLNLIETTSK